MSGSINRSWHRHYQKESLKFTVPSKVKAQGKLLRELELLGELVCCRGRTSARELAVSRAGLVL